MYMQAYKTNCQLDATSRDWACAGARAAVAVAPVRMHIAGVTCKDHSRRNQKALGTAGPHAPVLATWAAERRKSLEDVLIVENLASFPTDELQHLLSPQFQLAIEVVWGREDMGWWVNRRRKYMIFTRADAGVDLGEQGFTPQAFQRWFQRARPEVCEKGDMFYKAPDMLVLESKRQRSNRRRCRVQKERVRSDEALAALPWRALFSDGQCDRLKLYEKKAWTVLVATKDVEAVEDEAFSRTETQLARLLPKMCVSCLDGQIANHFKSNPLAI